ncbi:right-handed parallel beta-helix repeat-containing protein [Lentzea sp. NPDC058436]|uniref:right-handed parallel beta-helix repeat-containing protein n=1 Tax=Lentzea sp. NPDC058436 TaxID=3346499 RepID=UPI0036634792
MILLHRHLRPAVAVACAAAAAVSLVVVGHQQVLPPVQPHMLAGSTWLASRSVGHVTLVDGVSAAVSASVGVHQANVPFAVVLGKDRAYTVDPATGAVVAINPSTLDTIGLKPLSETKGLSVLAVGRSYFALDSSNRLVQAVGDDGRSKLGVRARLPGQVLDAAADSRRVWLADGGGSLQSFEVGTTDPIQRELHDVHQPGASSVEILIAGDQPLVVDRTHQTATLVSVTGEVTARTPFPVEKTDLVAAGSRVGQLLLVQPSHGVLMSCDVSVGTCGASHLLSGDLGTPVEARGHAFVPDRATHTVHVVNLAHGSSITTEPLLPAGAALELSTRDGLVFFNDPASEKAGVIDVHGVVRRINKYDPANPPSPSRTASSPPSKTTSSPSATSSGPRPSLTASMGSRPDGTAGSVPVPTGGSSPVPVVPHINGINASPNNPEAGEEVIFTADVTGTPPERWEWEVRGPGGVLASETTPQFKHRFVDAATYVVKLVVKAGTKQDERSRDVVVDVAVPSAECGETITQNVRLRKDLHCAGPGLIIGANDVVVDLGGHTLSGNGTDSGVSAPDRINATVRNGTIRAFNVGAAYYRTKTSTVDNVSFEGNLDADLGLSFSTDLTVQNSRLRKGSRAQSVERPKFLGTSFTAADMSFGTQVSAATFVNCRLTDSAVSANWNSNALTVTDSELTRSHIHLSEADGLNATRNRFIDSYVEIGAASRTTTFRNNEFVGAEAGIRAYNPYGAERLTVESNVFRDNTIGLNMGNDHQLPYEAFHDLVVTGNTFVNNSAAGLYFDPVGGGPGPHLLISGNTFTSNGHRSAGKVDRAGRAVNDGMHINVAPGSNIELRGNRTSNNADHGIEAQPGTVVDAGGNTSAGDPAGCSGVVCG